MARKQMYRLVGTGCSFRGSPGEAILQVSRRLCVLIFKSNFHGNDLCRRMWDSVTCGFAREGSGNGEWETLFVFWPGRSTVLSGRGRAGDSGQPELAWAQGRSK